MEKTESNSLIAIYPRVHFVLYANFLIWFSVIFLYSFQLSDILTKINIQLIYQIGIGIPLLFLLGFLFAHILFIKNNFFLTKRNIVTIDIDKLILRTKNLTIIFVFIVLFEFIVEGYIPLISMIKGTNISHFKFGISSLHGLVLSFGTLLFTTWFLIYYLTNNKVALFWLSLILILFAILVTRKMILVSVFQAILIAFVLRKNNVIFVKLFLIGLLVLLIFGWIGDIRTGRESFLDLSYFNVKYPEWLPSGFGWIYMYVTTPIANLANAIEMNIEPTFTFDFLSSLFPSVIRGWFFNVNVDGFGNEWQISRSFNVGTGFMQLFTSLGYLGVIVFTFILGFIYKIIILKTHNLHYFLILIIFSECSLFLIFGNNFQNLNTVSQFIFAYVIYGNFRFPHFSLSKTPHC